MAKKKPKPKQPTRGTPFTPFAAPTRPPAGMYDPAIDAQEGAAVRGLEDLRADTGTAGTRAQDDFYLGQGDIARSRQGVERSYGRGLADILTSRQRGEEDYGLATQNLGRQYQNLRSSQTQQGNQAGLLSGGFAAQAARKRAENQGLDQSNLDRNINRFREDSQRSEGRLGEDRDVALGENDSALARLSLGYQRGTEDRTTTLSRAEREGTFFGADLNTQRFYQAASAGYVPPERPRNEGTRNGVTYRKFSNGTAKLADGRIVSLAQLRKLIAQGAAR